MIRKIIILLLFAILIVQLVGSTLRESPLFDEYAFSPHGYEFLVHKDFTAEPFSPPLTREINAIPMLFDYDVIYDPTFFWPRMMTVIFTVILGVVVFLFSKKLYGSNAGIFSLFIYVFTPEILARGHYSMTDMISAFFIILSLYLYITFKGRFDFKKLAFLGVAVGCALASKTTALPFLGVTLSVFHLLENGKKTFSVNYIRENLIKLLFFASISLTVLWSTYFFTWEPPLGYRSDPNRAAIQMAKDNPIIKWALTQPVPLGSYMSSIKLTLRQNYTEAFVKESVFFGEYSRFGFYGYLQIPAMLIKTPIPILLFFASALVMYLIQFFSNFRRSGTIRIAFNKLPKEAIYPVVAIALMFALTAFTHVLFVIRYLLPVYPLIVIFSGSIINIRYKRNLALFVIGALSAWLIVGTLNSFPHYISYFNELVGGPKNGYKYLVEANSDLGQGLIALAEYQKNKNINNLQLAYFGTAIPSRYGIMYERIKDRSINDGKEFVPVDIENKTVAISATCWYFCGYYEETEFLNLEPDDIVGGSILIFKN